MPCVYPIYIEKLFYPYFCNLISKIPIKKFVTTFTLFPPEFPLTWNEIEMRLLKKAAINRLMIIQSICAFYMRLDLGHKKKSLLIFVYTV